MAVCTFVDDIMIGETEISTVSSPNGGCVCHKTSCRIENLSEIYLFAKSSFNVNFLLSCSRSATTMRADE